MLRVWVKGSADGHAALQLVLQPLQDGVLVERGLGKTPAGRAVIVTAHAGTELSNVVSGRGVVVAPGDAAALADAIEQLAMSRQTREEMGAAGRRFAEQALDQDAILQRLEHELQRCVAVG
jgi:colanic acid biosynthesis glycosyl transferase WcaI